MLLCVLASCAGGQPSRICIALLGSASTLADNYGILGARVGGCAPLLPNLARVGGCAPLLPKLEQWL